MTIQQINAIVTGVIGSCRGITFASSGYNGSFCAMPICYTGVQQWDCGAIMVDGKWSGGSQRLADAVRTLMPNLHKLSQCGKFSL